MGNLRVRPETGRLQFDFYFRNRRCREQTTLPDSPENRRQLNKILTRIEAAIVLGTFSYRDFFPDSRYAALFDSAAPASPFTSDPTSDAKSRELASAPSFAAFAEQWFIENEPRWRRSHKNVLRGTLNQHLS